MEVRIRDWMVDYFASVLDMSKDGFPIDDGFDEYGVDSFEIVIMTGLMEEEFGVPVEAEELFERPTVRSFAAYLAEKVAAGPAATGAAPATVGDPSR